MINNKAVIFIAILCLVYYVHCADNGLLRLVGESQGEINGDGNDQRIEINGFKWSLSVNVSEGSGTVTVGHITLTKSVDQSTPKLLRSLVNGERFSTFELKFYNNQAFGNDNYFTVVLQGARVVAQRQTQLNNLNRENRDIPFYEEIEFVGINATETWVITFLDLWIGIE